MLVSHTAAPSSQAQPPSGVLCGLVPAGVATGIASLWGVSHQACFVEVRGLSFQPSSLLLISKSLQPGRKLPFLSAHLKYLQVEGHRAE